MGLPPAASYWSEDFLSSEQSSLRPPHDFLRPHTIPQGPFDKPKEVDQLDGLEKWLWPGRRWLRLRVRSVCESENIHSGSCLRVEVLPEARSPLTFLGLWNLAPQDLGSIRPLTLCLSLLLCQTGLAHLSTPPRQLLTALHSRRSAASPRRPASPFRLSCVAGATRCPPAPSKARQAGLPATLTTVLAAKANISATGPRTLSAPPRRWAKSAPPPPPLGGSG